MTAAKTIAFNVLNRWTGAIQFTAQIECADDTPLRIRVGLALKWAFASGADLSDADLRGADLRGADLRGADLRGAVLSDAVLSGAVLSDAAIIFAGIDSRGYEFYLTADKASHSIVIRAGCRRWVTFAEARAHFTQDYTSNGIVPEVLAKLDLLEIVARARGYLDAATAQAA